MIHLNLRRATTLLTSIAVEACALFSRPTLNDYEANSDYAVILRRGINEFYQRHGQLPDSLIQICPSLAGEQCHWLPFGYQLTDAWGRRFRYARVGDEFELRSLGQDGRADTPDDFVFRPSSEREILARSSGCYSVSLPWWPEFPGTVLQLDTTSVSNRAYAAAPAVSSLREPSWSAIGSDSIAVS